MRTIALFLLTLPLVASEYAVLVTGFRLHAERHEVRDGVARLFTENGVIEVPADSILAYEPDDYVAPAPETANAESPSPAVLVKKAAERYGLPSEFLESVALTESAYRPDALSPKGAIGVMQLMPGTAAELGADPHDVEENVDAGARHLRDLLLEYDGGLYRTLAAYNAGPGAVSKYNGVPPYRETQNYVQKVIERYQKLSQQNRQAENR